MNYYLRCICAVIAALVGKVAHVAGLGVGESLVLHENVVTLLQTVDKIGFLARNLPTFL